MTQSEDIKWGMFLNTARPPQFTERRVLENAKFYGQVAEEMGFESAWMLEHHFTDYGLCGSPMVMASYILGATRRIKVGTAINILPLEHPVRLAEQAALLDQLSDGRFILGIGRGFFDKDFTVFGVDIHDTRALTHNYYDIMQEAWTKGVVGSDGPFLNFPPVPVNPRPYSDKMPMVCAAMSPSTIEWAAKNGLPMIMQHDIEHNEKASNVELYRALAEEHGHDPDGIEHTIAMIVAVDPDRERVREECRHYLNWFEDAVEKAQNIIDIVREHGVECYDWHLRKWREAVIKGDTAISKVVDNLLRLNAIGTPEDAIETIQHVIDVTGVKRVVVGFEAIGDRDRVLESMKLFDEQVRPHIRGAKI
ncbi:Alkanal monooxygenase alpha chain [Enhygromyxa salina]|uniref:bacterial luciferase n=2 Tax=Enhygromyxa salina TaxID=215803 RepID=A0A2S9XZH0_9BACT|nr:LLM class flavin-dependent oxidoreductase [Enhygromyxa salina]PRP98262.1 Alkanal monooxygenase alpha chain [Enhygromyxa salina]